MRPIFNMAILSLVLMSASCKGTKSVTTSAPSEPAAPTQEFPFSALQEGHVSIDEAYVEACTYMMRGDLENAEESFRNILEMKPEHHASMYNLARIHLEKREFKQALELARTASEADPENFWYRKTLTRVYESQGNLRKALEEQLRIHESVPRNREEWIRVAEFQNRTGQQEVSLQTIATIHQELGKTIPSMMQQYQWLTEVGRHGEAATISKELLEKDPVNPQWRNMQYNSLLKAGENEAALSSLTDWLDQDPGNGQAQVLLSEGYRREGNQEEANRLLMEAFTNPDLEAGWKVRYLEAYLKDDRIPVDQLLQALTQTHPSSPEATALSARLMAENQPADSVRALLVRSLDADPESFSTWIQLLDASYANGRYDFLYEDSRDAREFFPNSDKVLFYYGVSAAAMGEYSKAKRALQKLELLDPDDKTLLARALSEAARIYQTEDNAEEADRLLGVATTLDSDDIFVNSRVAWINALRGIDDRSVSRGQEAFLREFPTGAGKALKAGILQATGNESESLELIRQATDGSEVVEWLLLLGDLERNSGNTSAARSAYQRAYEAGADINPEERLQTP